MSVIWLRKRSICAVFGFSFLFLIYGAVYFLVQARTSAKVASMVSRLGEIRGALILYQNEHDQYPRDLDALAVDLEVKQDPLICSGFIYMPPQNAKNNVLIVMQAKSFRTRLWPFGEIRQYGLFTDGAIKVLDRGSDIGMDMANRQISDTTGRLLTPH